MTNRMSHYKKDDIIACKIWPYTKYDHNKKQTSIFSRKRLYLNCNCRRFFPRSCVNLMFDKIPTQSFFDLIVPKFFYVF